MGSRSFSIAIRAKLSNTRRSPEKIIEPIEDGALTMTVRIPEKLARVLLVLGSSMIAFLAVELGIRMAPPAALLAGYFPRYQIDGNRAPTIDYFTKDSVLPFALKPGYRHTLMDMAWHPVPFRVTLDGYGYRNQNDSVSEHGTLLVGDSVAFGFGVNDQETISAHLGKLSPTYNLAIPGAGPEMYMVMIDRFLRRAKPAQVAVLFFEGNDYRNLDEAYWSELGTCSRPGGSRIIRKDSPVPGDEQDIAVLRLKKDVANRYSKTTDYVLCELLGTYRQVSAAAITDLDNSENYKRKLKKNTAVALSYLEQLAAAPCVNSKIKSAIEGVIPSIRRNETKELAQRLRSIAAELARENCYPIGIGFPESKSGRSLTTSANNHAGYYYDHLASIKNGYEGNLNNFDRLLSRMERSGNLSSEYGRIANLKKILRARRGATSAADISAQIMANLTKSATACMSPASCDKEGIFINYLDSLNSRKVKVTIFTLPSEDALEYPARQQQGICRKASARGIKCVDLHPQLVAHYKTPNANGYYLDGSHLTAEGSAKVAQWMAANLGLIPRK